MTHRPWYRLHAATWGVGVVVAASLFVVNQHGIEIMLREYLGWPMHFASMGVFRDSSLFEQVKFADGVVPLWARVSTWCSRELLPQTLGHRHSCRLGGVLGGTWTVEAWCRRFQIKAQFSFLRVLLAMMATVVSIFGIKQGAIVWLDVLHEAAMLVTIAAMMLAWLAFFDVFALAYSRISKMTAARPKSNPASGDSGRSRCDGSVGCGRLPAQGSPEVGRRRDFQNGCPPAIATHTAQA